MSIKNLRVDGRMLTIRMPYDSHCDECQMHRHRFWFRGRAAWRIGYCRLFKKIPLTCDCGAPARLPECRAAECDSPCPDCSGTGTMHFVKQSTDGYTGVAETCARCGGTGRLK